MPVEGLPGADARNSRLAWLAELFEERFGIAFVLTESVGALTMDCPGSDGSIVFDRSSEAYLRPSSDMPMVRWDAAAEGWRPLLGLPLPAPGAEILPSPLIESLGHRHLIHFDIPGFSFWMLTRMEEVGRTDLDMHGRFASPSSHAGRHGYLDRPVVDEWLDILGQVIVRRWPGIRLKQHAFRMSVSHDVDVPSRYAFGAPRRFFMRVAKDLIERRDLRSAMLAPLIRRRSGIRLDSADPANTFDWIMDVSERHGLQSAFYFMCGRTNHMLDADYEPEHPAIRELMRRIHARGHEIGLHPSYGAGQERGAIAAEAGRLRRICSEESIVQASWGGRMHFLRWNTPSTLYEFAAAGLTYDSSLGYADRAGFRCGTCFEYPAFDPVDGRMPGLRIRPLVAMECTVIARRYMGLGTGDAALKTFRRLKDACRIAGGTFTLLWHNSELTTPGRRLLYEAVVGA